MSSIALPLPLIRIGLRPEPFLGPDADLAAIGPVSGDDLRELFRHTLFQLHECFVLLMWIGFEVSSVQIASLLNGGVNGGRAKVNTGTMEVGVGTWPSLPLGMTDGTYLALVLRERPDLPGRPIAMQVNGSSIGDEIVLRLADWLTWDTNLFDILSKLEPAARSIADQLRRGIRGARGETPPADWIRDPMSSGFFGLYDYTSWRTSKLELTLPGASAPILNIGELVWQEISGNGDAFDALLDKEPLRADPFDALLFLGQPLVSVSSRISALDPPGSNVRSQTLDHCVAAANVLVPDLLKASDLRGMSYTELLVVLNEIEAADVTLMSPLTGDALRSQILLRLDELSVAAHAFLDGLHDWQNINYAEFAHALEGETPSTGNSDWWNGAFGNALGEMVEAPAGTALNMALATWLAGAGTFVEPGVGTLLGFALGLVVSVVSSNLYTDSEAEQAVLISDTSQKIRHWEALWQAKVIKATNQGRIDVDERITGARLLTDPFTPDDTLVKLYGDIVADRRIVFVGSAPPTTDLSLCDSHLKIWLLENGWGFMPYDDQGQYAPRTPLVESIRTRVLRWKRNSNASLFISQCDFEWQSLGFSAIEALADLYRDVTWFADENRRRMNGRKYVFHSSTIRDELFLRKWSERYSSKLTFDMFTPAPPSINEGMTRLTTTGIQSLAQPSWSLTCTLRLEVRFGSCYVSRFDYQLQGSSAQFAERAHLTHWPVLSSIDWQPVDYHVYSVTPDIPGFPE